jgi:exosortase A-associated hydrolase 2
VNCATGPFYLPIDDDEASATAAPGQRFCIFHAPPDDVTRRGCVLAVHAFAEEMNKTRSASADGARALAAAGFAVLQIDLAGCGDSSGEFEDATWDRWLADLAVAWKWLALYATGPRWLWGVRLGALLADQFAVSCQPRADGLLLWQPIVNGAQHLGQFLRLKTVGTILREPVDPSTTPVARVAQPSPRADLASGLAIEVAGYRLTPTLADAIEAARLGAATAGDGRVPKQVRWFEVSSQGSPTLTPIAARVVERWRTAGSDVSVSIVNGSAFWQTQEVERCDALVEATVASLSVSMEAT